MKMNHENTVNISPKIVADNTNATIDIIIEMRNSL